MTAIDLATTSRLANEVLDEVERAVVGKREALTMVLSGVLAGGHVLIEDLPGLGKTLAARSFATTLGLSFTRAQFTPDLLPADLTGSFVYDQRSGEFVFRPGPLFTGLLLADEINRTPPKTQAALLEAMQERHVTAAGRTYPLEPPFFVLATQNPIELEGTYPLPEAQLDRFMFNVVMTYLSEDEEVRVVTQTTGGEGRRPDRVLGGADILAFQGLVRQVVIAEEVARYAVRVVDATRPAQAASPDFVKKYVKWGAGLRASQAIVLGAKARALMRGRYHVSVADVRTMALPALRHRVVTNFYAESEQLTSDAIVSRLLDLVPQPRSNM